VPRLANGKPNLAAPAPRTADGKPDLSGIWTKDAPNALDYFYDLAKDLAPGDVVMTPWAAGIAKQREARNHVDDPWGYCLVPPGVPRIDVAPPNAIKILQTPPVTALLYDLDTGPTFRQVHTDGRPLPDNPEPTWLGYSIGHMEGDTLVIETANYSAGVLNQYVEQPGQPTKGLLHSAALTTVERLHLDAARQRLVLEVDMADREFFTQPFPRGVNEYAPSNLKIEPYNCSREGVTGTIKKKA